MKKLIKNCRVITVIEPAVEEETPTAEVSTMVLTEEVLNTNEVPSEELAEEQPEILQGKTHSSIITDLRIKLGHAKK